jgi:F-type H+-transporting ATPase subunit a
VSRVLPLIPLEAEPEPGAGGEGETFEPPGVTSFDLPPIFEGVPGLEWLNKYVLQAFVAVILILIFWLVMANKNKMVPSRGQFVGETAYFFIRNSIARDTLGHDYKRFVPLLIALFSFVLVNNLWGIFPFTLLPTTSHAGWPYGLAIMVWVTYNGVGIAKHGFFGYLRNTVLPAGVPVFMWWLIIPLEFFSNIIVRPITLALRLFANMFAGHLLVLVFVLGGEYLIFHGGSIINMTAGVVAWIFSMAIFSLEIFVQALQAFIFTVLTAVYLSSALAEEH